VKNVQVKKNEKQDEKTDKNKRKTIIHFILLFKKKSLLFNLFPSRPPLEKI